MVDEYQNIHNTIQRALEYGVKQLLRDPYKGAAPKLNNSSRSPFRILFATTPSPLEHRPSGIQRTASSSDEAVFYEADTV